MRTRARVILLILLLPLLGLSFCRGGPVPPAAYAADAQAPIETVLSWAGQPGLGRSVTLTAQVTPQLDGTELRLHWVLPAGVALAGADSETLDRAAAGQSITRQVELTFEQEGTFYVAVSAEMHAPGQAIYGDADGLYFTIRDGPGSSVSRRGPGIASTAEMIPTPGFHRSPAAHPDQGFWVRGRFMYMHQPVTLSGPGTPVLVPARGVKVEIWEYDDIDDDHDGTVYTDDNGYFAFWDPSNDDGLGGGNKDIYLEIYAENAAAYVTDISWIDERYYCYTPVRDEQGGSDIDFGTLTPTNFHNMFHIADVVLSAYRYFTQYVGDPGQIKAQYEPGYNTGKSYFDNYWGDEIIIQDAPNDDSWDDTVIAHEYGHYLAATFACDTSPGGPHDINGHHVRSLAWSEGWASFFSSVVRNDFWYLDWNWATSSWAVNIDQENYSTTRGDDNEAAVTATLWDIYDPANEPHDRIDLDMADIWEAYHSMIDDTCTVAGFYSAWQGLHGVPDSDFTAVFRQYGTAGRQFGDSSPTVGVRLPWSLALFLVDRTNSMAAEIAAARQIVQNQVTDLDALTYAYQSLVYTFNDNGAYTYTKVADDFFPDIVNPLVGGITVGGGGDPPEDSFEAIHWVLSWQELNDADIWLLTDAPPKHARTSATELQGVLQNHESTPYFFVFGDCTGGNAAGTAETAGQPQLAPPSQLRLPRFSPDDMEDCIEPYLQVANATGGQLLLIDESQLNGAAEIVRALMHNSAAAGRYSNYVSSDWTYTWEDATYSWVDASGGTSWNISDRQAVALPQAFTFYNVPYSTIYVASPGYVSFSDSSSTVYNGSIPMAADPNNAIYAFWGNISAFVPGQESTLQTPTIYTLDDSANNRYVIEYYYAYHRDTPANHETFEIILDYSTGDVILQYQTVTDDSYCTVGVENAAGSGATQVSYNTPGFLTSGRAIRLSPQSPHPSNDHQVLVDSTMSGVLFLLNGYSGSVDMTLYRPNGSPVNPADPDVRYLSLGRLRYYRVDGPATGTWHAIVTGNGTYNFTSSAASTLVAGCTSDQTPPTGVAVLLLVDLGIPVPSASFHLVYPDGTPYKDVDLYDDGAHGDGKADDGLYGGWYTPVDQGTFYIQVDGQTPGGEPFLRTDMVPLRFQNMQLLPPVPAQTFAQPGQVVEHVFTLYNNSADWQSFYSAVSSSQGWASVSTLSFFVAPWSSTPITVSITIPSSARGLTDQTILSVQGLEESDSAAVTTTVRNVANSLAVETFPAIIAPNGYQARIGAYVTDDSQWGVADGTWVYFQTDLGTVNPAWVQTVGGIALTTLTSDWQTGVATVQATADSATGSVAVEISPPVAHTLSLEANPTSLPADGTSTSALTVYVYDKNGNPAPDGTLVVFSVNGDEKQMGSIFSQEVYTTTSSGGLATATYGVGTTAGLARVRATILLGGSASDGEGKENRRWEEVTLIVGGGGDNYFIYLPMVFRHFP